MRIWLIFLVMSSLAWAGPSPVALVTDVQGGATKDGTELALLTYLDQDAVVALQPGAWARLAYVSGKLEVSLTGPCEVAIQSDGVRLLKGEREAYSLKRKTKRGGYELPVGVNIARSGGVRRDPEMSLTLARVVRPDLALIEWRASPSVSGFELFVETPDGERLLRQEVGDSVRSLAVPSGLLSPGVSYEVRLEGYRSDNQELTHIVPIRVLTKQEHSRLTAFEPVKSVAQRAALLAVCLDLDLEGQAYRLTRSLLKERPRDVTLLKLKAELERSLSLSH